MHFLDNTFSFSDLVVFDEYDEGDVCDCLRFLACLASLECLSAELAVEFPIRSLFAFGSFLLSNDVDFSGRRLEQMLGCCWTTVVLGIVSIFEGVQHNKWSPRRAPAVRAPARQSYRCSP